MENSPTFFEKRRSSCEEMAFMTQERSQSIISTDGAIGTRKENGGHFTRKCPPLNM